jgi:amidase
MTDITLRSATAQLALLGQGRISAVELLELHLSRIEQLNPALNAVVALDVAKARAAALASDARRRAGQAGPLEGLPITIKDAFDVAGHISTAGANAFRERVPEEDAAAVARLRAAGAIIMAKSNVPVFSGDFQSYNPVYGVTSNPWDLSLSPGGSSGGACVAVATA